MTHTGLLKLTNQNTLTVGPGSLLGADKLMLQNVLRVNVEKGGSMFAPLRVPYSQQMKSQLYCDKDKCPPAIIPTSEDCNDNSPFSLHICRAEEVNIAGEVAGSIVHVNVRGTLWVAPGGKLSASGLGCEAGTGTGVGESSLVPDGASGGGGHGGGGGEGIFNGTLAKGGKSFGDTELPCELGSGGGLITEANGQQIGSNGGGVLVMGSNEQPIKIVQLDGSLSADGADGFFASGNSDWTYLKKKNDNSNNYNYNTNNSNIKVWDSSHLTRTQSLAVVTRGGMGGGSGGSILLYMETLNMTRGSSISSVGGRGGSLGGGGGGGGRVHFEWSNVVEGEKYFPRAKISDELDVAISTRGGGSIGGGREGGGGSLTTIPCPPGLFGLLCEECPVGTYKDEVGSDMSLCKSCPLEQLPSHAIFSYKRGGIEKTPCPYGCISPKYSMPHCNTPIEDLIEDLGGPWVFTAGSLLVLMLLALTISVARMKLIGNEDLSDPPQRLSDAVETAVDHSIPFLESLNEVMASSREEESAGHMHRIYFQGKNSFSDPFHLPHTPPEAVLELVHEDAYIRFVEDINSLAGYQWWEGCVYSVVAVVAYPFAWSWQQWRRRCKVQRLREFVHSEYDHSCLRSCRSRALYEGLKVSATPDLLLGYVDIFLGGDEKRGDLPPPLEDRLPMGVLFGGDGSYMAPYNLHSDNLLTCLVAQCVPATVWYRMVAGINAQLRTVRRGALRGHLQPLLTWIVSHANPSLSMSGITVELAQFPASTSSGYHQLGLVLTSAREERPFSSLTTGPIESLGPSRGRTVQQTRLPFSPASSHSYDTFTVLYNQQSAPSHNSPSNMPSSPRQALVFPPSQPLGSLNYHSVSPLRTVGSFDESSPALLPLGGHRRLGWTVISENNLGQLKDQRDIWLPFTLLLRNTRPVGHNAVVGMAMSILLLSDMSLSFLTLLQFYSISITGFWLVLLVLPFTPLFSAAAGLNALFSHGPRRAAGLGRIYNLWNVTSISNGLVAFLWGLVYHHNWFNLLRPDVEPTLWWILPSLLVVSKVVQARVVDRHVANLEIQDRTLYSDAPNKFWAA